MNCTLIIKVAASLVAATEVVLRHSGEIVATAKGIAKPAFAWSGLDSVLQFFTGDQLETADLPDLTEELAAIQTKLSKLGKVKISIELEPRIEPKE